MSHFYADEIPADEIDDYVCDVNASVDVPAKSAARPAAPPAETKAKAATPAPKLISANPDSSSSSSSRKPNSAKNEAAVQELINGKAAASKVIGVSAQIPVSALVTGDATITFSAKELLSIFQVKARNGQGSTYERVGDPTHCTIVAISLRQAWLSGTTPLDVSLPGTTGKIYALGSGTGRAGGRSERRLFTLNPGATVHTEPKLLFQRVSMELLMQARILSSFDVNRMNDGVDGPLSDDTYMVANESYMANVIRTQASVWQTKWEDWPSNNSKTHRYVRAALIDFARKALLDLHAKLQAGKNDLTRLSFKVSSPFPVGDRDYFDESDTVRVNFELIINYAFLTPWKLTAAAKK